RILAWCYARGRQSDGAAYDPAGCREEVLRLPCTAYRPACSRALMTVANRCQLDALAPRR
ncbi:MAG: hypothetical protein J0I75_24450, partial [Hyphomicrobium sp.]|nr:hypothetical protein [Hyphomicrobium sp.]